MAYLPLDLTFIGHFWRLSESAFSNAPCWSLAYEVWYYVLFAIAVFGRGATRWVLLVVVMGGMGPKLWLLLPIWAGGVPIAHLWRWKQISSSPCRLLVLVATALFAVVKVMRLEEPADDLAQAAIAVLFPFPLGFSQWFAGDFGVGCLTMGLVYGLGGAEFRFPTWLGTAITGFAKLSFGLYLVHYPLLLIWRGLLPSHGWLAMGLALLCALSFAALAEPRKDRARRMLTWLVNRLRSGRDSRFSPAGIQRDPGSNAPVRPRPVRQT